MSRRIPEAIYQSALRLDPKSLLSLCRTNSQYNRDLCNNETFWTDKLIIDFGDNPLFIRANQDFSDIVPNKIKYQIFYNPKEQDIEDSIEAELYDLMMFLILRSPDQNIDYMIEYLALHNKDNLIKEFLSKLIPSPPDLDEYTFKNYKYFSHFYLARFRGNFRRLIRDGKFSQSFDLVTFMVNKLNNIIDSIPLATRDMRRSLYLFDFAKSFIIALENSLDYLDNIELYQFIQHFSIPFYNKYVKIYRMTNPKKRTYALVRRLEYMTRDYIRKADYPEAVQLLNIIKMDIDKI